MELRRRLLRALAAIALFVAVAVVGLHTIGHGVSWLDALYMVVISLTGVGYSEIVDTSRNPSLRVFNIVILVCGVSMMMYVLSLATAFLVEGNIGSLFRRRRQSDQAWGWG